MSGHAMPYSTPHVRAIRAGRCSTVAMTDIATPRFREATDDEADGLALLERSANLQALAHIFPPEKYPYPTDDVRDRWREVLQNPSVHVGVAEDVTGLAAFVAFDDNLLRHLAVRPDLWGTGLAGSAVNWACGRATVHRLWCLEENTRARGFYGRLGWTPTGRRRRAEFPPYPAEVELASPRSSPDWRAY
jgi:RimJ/RimL family protein N-acetyltransferase